MNKSQLCPDFAQLFGRNSFFRNALSAYIRKINITDAQLSYIEAFGAKIRHGIDAADFYTKRQIIELLDIHGKITIENGEKVIYLKCLIEPTEDEDFS